MPAKKAKNDAAKKAAPNKPAQVTPKASAFAKSSAFVVQEKTIIVNELKPAFNMASEKADLVFKVRALTLDENLTIADSLNGSTTDLMNMVQNLVGNNKLVEAATELFKEQDSQATTNPKGEKYRETVRFGLVEPPLTSQQLFQLSSHFPGVFMRLFNSIMELTGKGAEVKKN